jgi:hypothetical protein
MEVTEDIQRMQKKEVRLGLRISSAERKTIDQFCLEKGIVMSEFIRYAVRKIIAEIEGKQ